MHKEPANEILKLIKTRGSEFEKIGLSDLEPVQEGVYHLHSTPPYFIKWILDDDSLGTNELWVNQTFLPEAKIPTPRLVFSIKSARATLAGWEWLDGVDLRYQHRDLLPLAFAQLGYFHDQKRHCNRVNSLITHRSFDTVTELLSSEFEFLCANQDSDVREKAAAAFSLLETGYPTIIHGDMHPGNIRLNEKGLKFVDWGYCTSSLNLFDLGYIETEVFGSNKMDWWQIKPEEAESILPAYYDACKLKGCNFRLIQCAVMLWSQLWGYFNCIQRGDQSNASICSQQINQLCTLI